MTNNELEQKYSIKILADQPNYDASVVVGKPVQEMAVVTKRGPATYYIDEDGTLQWDVSGFPSWYELP